MKDRVELKTIHNIAVWFYELIKKFIEILTWVLPLNNKHNQHIKGKQNDCTDSGFRFEVPQSKNVYI